MPRVHTTKSLKSFANIFAGLALTWALVACSGMGGFATGSKDGEGGAPTGGALDEISSGGGVQVAGPGPGGLPGASGGMGPIDPSGGGGAGTGGGSTPGGPSDPFGGAGGTPGGGGAAPGSGGECSGGVCSSDTPSGFLIGNFNIHATLFVDPAIQGGNCNSLYPPPGKKQVCRYVRASARPSGLSFGSLWMGNAWALPQHQGDVGDPDTELPDRELVCEEVTYQPPIDPALIPRVVLKISRPTYTGNSTYVPEINGVPQVPQCGPSGQWLFNSSTIKVYLSPYTDAENTWVVQVDALYPKDGSFELRGSKTVTMHCGWDSTGSSIQCQEQVSSPLGEVLAQPAQGNVLSR